MSRTTGPIKGPSIGSLIFYAASMALGVYFTFAAVQGDFGLFRRVEIAAEAQALSTDLDRLQAEIVEMENLTLRLSDGFLDLDLLDEQARSVLGLLRADELVIR
jgi:cell division protein FtsB